jgi:tetratricopeptide (TPR) repeat protein
VKPTDAKIIPVRTPTVNVSFRPTCAFLVTTFLAATLAAGTLLVAAPAAADVPQTASVAEQVELRPVPEPNLEGMDDDVRQQLAEKRQAVNELRAAAGTDPAELGRALGELGALYFLYGQAEPAAAALANAADLAPEEARWTYLLAFVQQNEGDLDAAQATFQRTLAGHPEHVPTLVRLGEVELAAGRPDEAAEYFGRAFELRSTCARCAFGLGQAAAAQGNAAAAVQHFRTTLQLQPGADAVHYPLGQALRQAGDLEAAQAELEQVGQTEVSFPDPLLAWVRGLATGAGVQYVRGRRALAAGNLDAAVSLFRQATEADPENVAIHRALGLALGRSGDHDAAVAEYLTAVKLEPSNPLNHQELGVALVDAGRPAEAAAAFARAVDLDPEFAAAHLSLGIVLTDLGQLPTALAHLQRAVELEPENGDARYERAMVLARMGRGSEAVAGLRELIEREPDRLPARLNLGTLLELAGDDDGARSEMQAILAGDPAPLLAGRAQVVLGRLAERAGDAETAKGHYRQAIELNPSLPPAKLRLASVLAGGGDYAAAAQLYGEVLAAVPAHREARMAHATCLLLTGRDADAAASLEAGLRALPDDPYLQYALALLRAAAPEEAVRNAGEALELARAAYAAVTENTQGQAVAMAYAENGQFEEAVRAQERLLAALPAADPRHPGAQARLQLYKAGRPARAPWSGDPTLLFRPTVPLAAGQ